MSYRIMFDERFAARLESGEKCQTIRSLRRPAPTVGDTLELCVPHPSLGWQMITDATICTSVQHIWIGKPTADSFAVMLAEGYLCREDVRELALADGFDTIENFARYFEPKVPFAGVLIKWRHFAVRLRPAASESQPTPRECNTCRHEGKSLEEWPCRTSMSMAGLMCWEPKDDGL
jgi:hypothetical protein